MTRPTRHLADRVESERRQRPLDRQALGIGETLEPADFNRDGEDHYDDPTPHQSANLRPVTISYAAT